MKKCKHCGNEFPPERASNAFCCPEHKEIYQKNIMKKYQKEYQKDYIKPQYQPEVLIAENKKLKKALKREAKWKEKTIQDSREIIEKLEKSREYLAAKYVLTVRLHDELQGKNIIPLNRAIRNVIRVSEKWAEFQDGQKG